MKKYLFFLASALLLMHCTKPVNIDIEEEPLIVIQGFLFDGKKAQVRISRSFNILSTEMYNYDEELGYENIDTGIVFLQNAEVKWYEDDQFLENLSYTKNGYFEGHYPVTQGHTYRIEVNAAGFPPASGLTTVPEPVPLDSMKLSYFATLDYQTFYKGTFYFRIPAGKRFLAFTISSRSIIPGLDGTTDTVETGFSIGQRIEEQRLNSDHPVEGGFYVEYGSETSQNIALDFFLAKYAGIFKEADTVLLWAQIKTVPEDYINLQTSLHNYHENGGGFGNPFNSPVQIYNNIDGGLGIFTGLSADTLFFPFIFNDNPKR